MNALSGKRPEIDAVYHSHQDANRDGHARILIEKVIQMGQNNRSHHSQPK